MVAAVEIHTAGGRRLRLWGSECTDCGNATHGSQRCDQCQTGRHTNPLYQLLPEPEKRTYQTGRTVTLP